LTQDFLFDSGLKLFVNQLVFVMAWCRCGPKVSEFNVDFHQNNSPLTLDENLLVEPLSPLGAVDIKKCQLTPLPLAEEDDYDPRKPEFVVQASLEETGAKDADLIRQQMSHLRSVLTRRKDQTEETPEKIINHYERVLEELGHVLDSTEQGEKIESPLRSRRPCIRLFAGSDEAVTHLSPSPKKSAGNENPRSGILDTPSPLTSKSSQGQWLKGVLLQPNPPLCLSPPSKYGSPLIAREGNVSSLAVTGTRRTHCASPSTVTLPAIEESIRLPRECGHVNLLPRSRPQGGNVSKESKQSEVSCVGSFGIPWSQRDPARMLVRCLPVSTIMEHTVKKMQDLSLAKLPF
jgi:hypothetical protein